MENILSTQLKNTILAGIIILLSIFLGYNLFLMRAMAPKEITLMDIYKSIIPFVLVMTLGLAVVMAFPEMATWLPEYVSRK